jgi:hypothetical protein
MLLLAGMASAVLDTAGAAAFVELLMMPLLWPYIIDFQQTTLLLYAI